MGLLALMGQHPLSANDKTIYKALLEVSPSTINPDRQYPFGPPAPADASHHSRSSSLVIGMSFAMALVILVTGARLWVRTFRSRALGADDITIIPAAIGSLAYMALDISIVRAGGLGKHLYDCTYEEIGWFVTVRRRPSCAEWFLLKLIERSCFSSRKAIIPSSTSQYSRLRFLSSS